MTAVVNLFMGLLSLAFAMKGDFLGGIYFLVVIIALNMKW